MRWLGAVGEGDEDKHEGERRSVRIERGRGRERGRGMGCWKLRRCPGGEGGRWVVGREKEERLKDAGMLTH